MDSRSHRNAIVAAAILLAAAPAAAQSPAAAQFYTQLKDAEKLVPVPPINATVEMGVFDAATGKLGPPPGVVLEPEVVRPEGGKPVVIEPTWSPGYFSVVALSATLKFRFANRGGQSCTVQAGGRTTTVSSDVASVSIGSADDADWAVACGTRQRSGHVRIAHNIAAAGGFRVAAVPVSVIYEPPMDRRKLNAATYRTQLTLGSATAWSFEHADTTTTPSTPSEFAGVNAFSSKAALLATGLSKVNNPYAQAASGVLTFVSAAIGSATAANTTGTMVTTTGAVVVEVNKNDAYTTGAKLGPGHGDRLLYLRNARVAWLAEDQGKITLALVGWDSMSGATVDVLTADLAAIESQPAGTPGPVTGLDAATITGLLSVDPFTPQGRARASSPLHPHVGGVAMPVPEHVKTVPAGPIAIGGVAASPRAARAEDLDPRRFEYYETYEVNAAEGDLHSASKIIESTTGSAASTCTARTEEYSEAFLSFLGIGVSESKTVTTSERSTTSEEYREGRTVEAEVKLWAEADEMYAVGVYYDRIFGSFAFVSEEIGSVRLTGLAMGAGGKPLSRQRVELRAGGRSYVTTTDAKGRYAFRTRAIPAGAATLKLGKKAWPVSVSATRTTAFDIRL